MGEESDMTIHWPTLSTEARIEAIKATWHLGISMLGIAKRLNASRSSIAGFYFRHRDKLPDHPLNRQTESLAKAAEARRQRVKAQPKAKAVKRTPVAPFVRLQRVDEDYGPGVPMLELAGHQCRWAVNDAPRPEDHLFCGRPADGSYCAHHTTRSTATEIGWGMK
jgi:hypothetical protein